MVGLRSNSDYFCIHYYISGCVTHTLFVYCAVGTESLNVIRVNLSLKRISKLLYSFCYHSETLM
jgi:hypothetical protein